MPELRPPLKDLQSAIRLGTEIETALRQFVAPATLAELSHDLIALHDEKLADELLRPQERLKNLPHQLRLEMTPTQTYRAAILGIATGTILREFPLHSDREAKLREVGGMEGIERLVGEDIQHGIEGLKGAIRENLAELQRQFC